MDSLTHLLVGHAMGALAGSVAGPHSAAAYWAVLIGNSLPDIDVPISLVLRRGIKLHRTLTHTLPGAFALSTVTSLGLRLFFPGAPLGITFFGTLLGCLSHMALDCLNLFGARPFWPLSGRSVDLGILHIMDPILLVILVLPALARQFGLAGWASDGLSFLLIWPYVLYRVWTAGRLHRKLQAAGSRRARVVPWFASWRYLVETDRAIEFGRWQRGRRIPLQTYPRVDSPLIRASLSHPQVADFLKSAQYPYALVEEGEEGTLVVWADALRQLRADFRPLKVRVQ
jgi:membrane-bound metal-dependent hydrolase YbcI (DUF457 family)